MNIIYSPPLIKIRYLILVSLLLSFTTKSFGQTLLPDTLYHPTIPKIDRIPDIEAASELKDKGGSFMTRNIVGPTTYDLYRKRKYNKIEAAIKMKNTVLLVVVNSEESGIGRALKQAFSVYWKYNNYKFIHPSEVINYAGKEGYSFFMFVHDEHYVTPIGQRIGSNSWNPPYLYYISDTLQHVAIPGYFGRSAYLFTYMFVISLSNGKPINETEEDKIMQNVSIVDYIVPIQGYDPSSGKSIQSEEDMIPQFNTIVANFQDDLDYINRTKKEYSPVVVPVDNAWKKVYLNYEAKDVKARTGINFYGNGEKLLKTKKILIDSSIADNMSKQFLSKIIEVDTTQIQLVNIKLINDAIEKKDESLCYITKPCTTCGGLFVISDTYGRKLADFSGVVYALLSGSLLNQSALESLNANLFDKKADAPELRKKIHIETK